MLSRDGLGIQLVSTEAHLASFIGIVVHSVASEK